VGHVAATHAAPVITATAFEWMTLLGFGMMYGLCWRDCP
jgi:hypothetical protein